MILYSAFSQIGNEPLRVDGITIHTFGREAPIIFAAEELIRYLPRLLPNAKLEVYVGHPDQALAAAGFLRENVPPDGAIAVRGDGRRYSVSGGSPAAVLHATYAFLEALGARWVKPGPEGEAVRPLDIPPPPLEILSTPAFSRRGLADGCLSWWPGPAPFQEWLEEMRHIVDWMGKMRLNRLFVHFNQLPPGDLSPLLPELERRGIALELGGHSLPKLLPPGIREEEPSICRMRDGVRRPDGNFCTANPRTLKLLEEGARRFAGQLPPADLYHLWPCDASEEPWCSCPECRSISADRQMWRAVRAAAEGLLAVRPAADVSGLLYHESLRAVESAPPGVELLFAPRERCYLHPIDGDCPRNSAFLRDLNSAVAGRGGSLTVLEYYGDPILFGRPANLPRLVESDLAAYRSAGVTSVSALVFGALSWWLYPLQLYCYARGAWDGGAGERGDGGTGRRGEWETGRRGDGGSGRWGDAGTRRRGDAEIIDAGTRGRGDGERWTGRTRRIPAEGEAPTTYACGSDATGHQAPRQSDPDRRPKTGFLGARAAGPPALLRASGPRSQEVPRGAYQIRRDEVLRSQTASYLEDYCGVVGGEAARGQLIRYYILGEEAAGGHFRFCGYGADGSWATLPFPPGQPSKEVREQLADLRMGLDRLLVAGRLLDRITELDDVRLRDTISAHRFETSFHRALVMEFAQLTGNWEGDPRKAFARALETLEEVSPEALGVFGRHWMLPWLRRCAELGCKAPM